MKEPKLTLKKLLSFEIKAVVLGMLTAIAAAISSVALLGSAAWFLSAMAIAGSAGLFINIFIPSALIRMFAVSRTVLRYAERLVTHNATFKIIAHLRTYLFKHILEIDFKEALQLKKSDSERRFRENTLCLEYAFLRDALPKFLASVVCSFAVIFISCFDLYLGLILIAMIGICAIFIPMLVAYLMQNKTLILTAELSAVNDCVTDIGDGLMDIVVSGSDNKLKEDLLTRNERICKIKALFILVEELLSSLTHGFAMCAMLISLYITAPDFIEGKISGSCYVLISIIACAVYETVFPLALSFSKFTEIKQAFWEINHLIGLREATDNNAEVFDEKLKAISFDKVSFSYKANSFPVIQNFSAVFVNSKNYAITAKVGCGKTTLVYLMTGLLKNYSGTILLNGKNLKNLQGSSVRKCFAVLPQGNEFFSGTIVDMFKTVNPDLDEDAILKILDQVELLPFVKSLPDGLHQFLGNNGVLVSGGQARRLVLARALCINSDFLILDEPGEGLDAAQEQRILNSVLNSRKGVILISHKIGGLNFCDEIIRI